MRTAYTVALLFLSFLEMHAMNRSCAVAGSFYPQDKKELSTQLSQLFKDARKFDTQNINAIIVPHAGYIFSAPTATLAYKTLHQKYKNIFLIGSSHHINVNGASIYTQGNYQTPLGEVKVNQEITSRLLENTQLFSYHKDAHTKEHTLEVQLPFLQKIYGEDLQIVPIIIATSDIQTIKAISESLRPYFNEDNLFVISTDLSHYPSYENAAKVDKRTLEAITTNKPQIFLNTLQENEALKLNELYTSACGWASVLTLMYLSENKDFSYELLDYTNSGDTKYGDKNRVVGYGSFRVYSPKEDTFLTHAQKEQLLQIAKLSLYEATLHNKRISLDLNKLHPKLKEHLGAFVTLYKDNQLRGCIGRFEPNQTLAEVVVAMAIAAAQHDTRFLKVSPLELENIKIEISVLTPRKKIKSLDEIEIGKHGVYVKNGTKSGTYLPHVATQMNWNTQQFVQSCAIEKAGMTTEEMAEMELFTYEAIVFENK